MRASENCPLVCGIPFSGKGESNILCEIAKGVEMVVGTRMKRRLYESENGSETRGR
jgi:hypothetical protein